MITLALDTTTRTGSAAIARDGAAIEEARGDPERPTATRLPADVTALLERHGLRLADVDLFAVAAGPGSFTGLRIGIATMQGLAFAAKKPLIGISGLDALADVAMRSRTGLVAAWVDAWRGEVYAALYENGREIVPATVDLPHSILAVATATALRTDRDTGSAGALAPAILFIGDGAATYRDLIATTLGSSAAFPDPVTPLIAASVARLATQAAQAGHQPPPHAIRPLYVRRPDAELARSRARGLAPQTP